jgi:spermidine synthase
LKYFTDPDLAEERKYIEAHRDFFTPDRTLFLDGVTQSTLEGLAPYHEALVQPAMFTHPNPKRVAIVGGGECATLRETLKHNTVETVVMVEIDPVIVEVSKHFLPEWNDCSMFEGSSRYCMDDSRVEMYHLDALKWFRDRFSEEARLEGNEFYGTEEKFDVVILDALDPQNAVDFVEALYGDGPFMNSLYNSLTDDGVLLTQVGEAISVGDQAETYPENFNYQRFMYESGLKNQGFKVVMNYEEPRAGFDGIWSFFAAFKSDSSRARWQMNEAQFDIEIHKRSIRRVGEENVESGEIRGIMDYFDGPTMATYRYPSKHAQVLYCQRDPKPHGCTTDIRDHEALQIPVHEPMGFDPNVPNLSAENFGITNNRVLVSRVEVSEKSYIMLEQSIHDVQISPSVSTILQSGDIVYDRTISPVTNFVTGDRGGLTIPRRGATYASYRVDSGLLSFLGHGCGGTFNAASLNDPSSVTEATADPDTVPQDGLLEVVQELVFNPSFTRNSHLPEFVVSSRKISIGEGITSNFVPWYNESGWKSHIESLRSKCSDGV